MLKVRAGSILKSMTFAIGLVGCAAQSGAATITFTDNLTTPLTNIAGTPPVTTAPTAVSLPKFNIPGAILNSVSFGVTSGALFNILTINTSLLFTETITATDKGDVSLSQPNLGGALTLNFPTTATSVSGVAVFGIHDFFNTVAASTVMKNVPGVDVSAFQGPGNIPNLNIDFTDASSASATYQIGPFGIPLPGQPTALYTDAAGQLNLTSLTFGPTATVTYNYTVPEPGTFAIAFASLSGGAMSFVRRRRRA